MEHDFWNQMTIMERNLQLAESNGRSLPVQHGYEAAQDETYLRRASMDDAGQVRPWFGDQEEDQQEMEALPIPEWRATVIVYHFQATPERLTCWIEANSQEADVTHAVGEELYQHEEDRFVYPMVPQPCDGCLHYVAASAWFRGMGLRPVVIDFKACGGHRFVILAGSDLSYDDIQAHLGVDWPRGADIWYLPENRRIRPGEVVASACGHVFAVMPADSLPTSWEFINARIQHPWTWAREVKALGYLSLQDNPFL